jgi:hypothetical protein
LQKDAMARKIVEGDDHDSAVRPEN